MATQPGIMGIVTTIVGLFSGEIFLGFIFGVALAGIALLGDYLNKKEEVS